MSLTGTVTHVANSLEDTPNDNSPGYVFYTPQLLTPSQQQQVIANIGAVSESVAGSFINEVVFDSVTGSFTFVSALTSQTFQLPLFDSVRNLNLIDNQILVEFNNSELNKIIDLPSHSAAIIINDLIPDSDGRVKIGIDNIPDLRSELDTRATNTDISVLRGLKIVSDEMRKELIIKDLNNQELNRVDVSWLANSNTIKTPKSEIIRLSQEHIDAENLVLELENVPSENEFVFTFCNGVLLNSAGISIVENILIIDKKTIEYEFRVGMKITVNYKY